MAAQSLANVDRIESDVASLEVIAGRVLLLAVFFGTLLIGLKAAQPGGTGPSASAGIHG